MSKKQEGILDAALVGDSSDVSSIRSAEASSSTKAHGHYNVVCRDADGNIKWEDEIENLITTQGKNFNLDTVLSGSGFTAAWYMGLISSVSYGAGPAVGDTAAQINGTNGWKEAGLANAPTTSASRPSVAFSAAAAGSKAASPAVSFSFTGAGTVKGCFLVSTNTKDGTTGTLYSVGLFTGGDRSVINGDTLAVSFTASLT